VTLFQAAVEGDLDEAVLRRLVAHCGAQVGVVYGREGKDRIEQNIRGYNNAAKRTPWVVLVDLDESECAASLRQEWLPEQSELMCFRIAVREVESWLLADRSGFARFAGISRALVPNDPDALPNAKATVVQLAARSNKRLIREAIPPAEGSKRNVGTLYNPTLGQFVADQWDPTQAALCSDSLGRCLRALEDLRSRTI
jgi:hypothetical protein